MEQHGEKGWRSSLSDLGHGSSLPGFNQSLMSQSIGEKFRQRKWKQAVKDGYAVATSIGMIASMAIISILVATGDSWVSRIREANVFRVILCLMARPERLELPTNWFEASYLRSESWTPTVGQG